MTETVISSLSAILVAIIGALSLIDQRKRKREEDMRENSVRERVEESRLSMKMMNATLQLSIVTANALTGGHNNGNVEKARKAAAEAEKEYGDFLGKIASREIFR